MAQPGAQGLTVAVLMGRACLSIAAAIAMAGAVVTGALAFVSDTADVSGNTFALDTLNPPTGLSAGTGSSITLNWTATVDTYASGHRVFRSSTPGGSYTQIAQVTPRTTTTYVDSPSPGTHYYVLRAYKQNWESVDSTEVSAGATTSTGYQSCTANAAVTTSSGDNDGFQLNPGNACADDAAFAEDTNSGTGTGTNCTGSGKDKHLYYNYGMSLPAGSVVNGIEVRLDAWADATSGSPRLCAQLSWDGGASWVTAKTISTNLTTGETTYTLGSASDTWGRTWTASELSDTNFIVRITSRASNTARDFRLDWVAVQVTYTP